MTEEIKMKEEIEIIKNCYEERYGTQKYKDSSLRYTYERVVLNVIKKAKEEVVNKVDTLDDDIITYMNWRDILKQKLKEGKWKKK